MLCSWCAVCWRSSSGRWMKKSCTYSSPTRRGRREPTVSHIHTNKFFTILIHLSSQVSFWHVSLYLDLTNIVELVHRQTHWESIDFCCCFGHTLHELTMRNRYVYRIYSSLLMLLNKNTILHCLLMLDNTFIFADVPRLKFCQIN